MNPQHPRAGKGFFKFLGVTTVLAGLLFIGGVRWFSGSWRFWEWQNIQQFFSATQPAVEESWQALLALKEEVWGDGGLVDDMNEWLDERKRQRQQEQPTATGEPATVAEPPPVEREPPPVEREPPPVERRPPPAPTVPAASEETKHLARRLYQAEDTFAEGMVHFDRANPSRGGVSDATFAEVAKAKRKFEEVRDVLMKNIDKYAARPDHNPATLSAARELQRRNQKVLHHTIKMSR